MTKTRVCVAGATGWVGKPLCQAIESAEDLQLAGAVSRSSSGKPIEEITGLYGNDLKIAGSVEEALASATDVLVDYTKPDAVKGNVLTAVEKGVHAVIGTSGLSETDFTDIAEAAKSNGVGVIAAGNFAITAVLMQRFAAEAAVYLSSFEIIDYASESKPDAPSGTARELASRLADVRSPVHSVPVEETIGERDSRGSTLNGVQVHSIRVPGFVLSTEAVFGAPEERLTIRHDAGSSTEPYIQGTLLAIRRVKDQTGLVRGLEKIM
ncbi:MAG: 4-hydroxy-tetrahydrodipicolinate reductase [Acidobacteria bacterium]|nr:MAG: 4-hydroxy-tetrahydrodipicolinate reductase [Acidobacteriota bacterium]REJ98910.1 MAG: 4-hydroxy-tetrahydrodipicolinate reductase [Acidobacteriota bacterium]REK16371.1 MAG: 4-hydroxy-tetrahydrodipicolinate reductase [Acidobacteriota bacterium]REK44052.1 MAG: 4-hydroxy-tetrahydrodipicolinate reductase [Acidobacteriota bacterium]